MAGKEKAPKADRVLSVIAGVSIAVAMAGTAVGFCANAQTEEYLASALAWKRQAEDFEARLAIAKGQLADAERRIAEAQKGLTREQRSILASHISGRPGTLAYKNKNPLNIKHLGKQKWIGEVGRDYLGHVQFSSIHYGIRAAVMTLYSYETRHGVKDLTTLINRFCGGNEDYVAFLSRNMNLKPDEKFSITKRMPELIKLMSLYESGHEVKQEVIATLDILKRM